MIWHWHTVKIDHCDKSSNDLLQYKVNTIQYYWLYSPCCILHPHGLFCKYFLILITCFVQSPTLLPSGDHQFYFCSHEPFCFIICLIFIFCFLWLHLQNMEVPRLGVKFELQLLAYTTATPDPSRIWNLYHNSGPLTYWAGPGIKPTSSWILARFISTEPQWELLSNHF